MLVGGGGRLLVGGGLVDGCLVEVSFFSNFLRGFLSLSDSWGKTMSRHGYRCDSASSLWPVCNLPCEETLCVVS